MPAPIDPTRVDARHHSPQHQPIAVALIHPDTKIRVGIHHAWVTCESLCIRGVASSVDELHDTLAAGLVCVAVAGLDHQQSIQHNQGMMAQLCKRYPKTHWVFLSSELSEVYRHSAQHAGADGYLEGVICPAQLESLVTWVSLGRRVFTQAKTRLGSDSALASSIRDEVDCVEILQDISEQIQSAQSAARNELPRCETTEQEVGGNMLRTDPRSPSVPAKSPQPLSQREREVWEGIVNGKTNQQIADQLFLSVKTIETYRSRLKKKLGASNRTDLVAAWNAQS